MRCAACHAPLPQPCGRGRPRATCDDDCRREHINAKRRHRARRATLALRLYEKGEAAAPVRDAFEPWRVELGGLV